MKVYNALTGELLVELPPRAPPSLGRKMLQRLRTTCRANSFASWSQNAPPLSRGGGSGAAAVGEISGAAALPSSIPNARASSCLTSDGFAAIAMLYTPSDKFAVSWKLRAAAHSRSNRRYSNHFKGRSDPRDYTCPRPWKLDQQWTGHVRVMCFAPGRHLDISFVRFIDFA